MIKTHGLTHVALRVKDPERSLRFYKALFGVREYVREDDVIQALGPGPKDVIVFERCDPARPRGGIDHFGFRLEDPSEIDNAIKEANAIGAEIVSQGEHAPGFPYLNILDPDGHQIEIWFE